MQHNGPKSPKLPVRNSSSTTSPPISPRGVPDDAVFFNFSCGPVEANNIMLIAHWAMNPEEPQIFKLLHDDAALFIFLGLMPLLNETGDVDLLPGEFRDFQDVIKELSEKISVEKEDEQIVTTKEEFQKVVALKFIEISEAGKKVTRKYNINHLLSYLTKNALMHGNIFSATNHQVLLKLQCSLAIFTDSLKTIISSVETRLLERESLLLPEELSQKIQVDFLRFLGQLTLIDPMVAKIIHNFISLSKKVTTMSTEQLAMAFSSAFSGAFQLDFYLPSTDETEKKEREKYREVFKRAVYSILSIPQISYGLYDPSPYKEYTQQGFESKLRTFLCPNLLESPKDLEQPKEIRSKWLEVECSLKILEEQLKNLLKTWYEERKNLFTGISEVDFSTIDKKLLENSFITFLGQLSKIDTRLAQIIHNALHEVEKKGLKEEKLFSHSLSLLLQLKGKLFVNDSEMKPYESSFFKFFAKTLLEMELFSQPYRKDLYAHLFQPGHGVAVIKAKREGNGSWRKTHFKTKKALPPKQTRSVGRLKKFTDLPKPKPGPGDSKELYREIKGGKPKPTDSKLIHRKRNQTNKEEGVQALVIGFENFKLESSGRGKEEPTLTPRRRGSDVIVKPKPSPHRDKIVIEPSKDDSKGSEARVKDPKKEAGERIHKRKNSKE